MGRLGWGDDDAPDPGPEARLEAENALRQTDWVYALAEDAIRSGRPFVLTPEHVCELARIATEGLVEEAGQFRQIDKEHPIFGSRHRPPPFVEVPGFVTDMCETINRRPQVAFAYEADDETLKTAIDSGVSVGAFALWRLNWIHPFLDGNGRTSRALCFLLVCVHVRMVLPGQVTMPERIARDARRYYRCLAAADRGVDNKRNPRVVRHPHALDGIVALVYRHLRAQLSEHMGETPAR